MTTTDITGAAMSSDMEVVGVQRPLTDAEKDAARRHVRRMALTPAEFVTLIDMLGIDEAGIERP